MAKFGHLQEFDTDLEPITAYLERVELYFSANGIGEDKKLAILLSVIGPKTYGVLRNLLAPSRPQEKKFSEVTEVLIRHFEPKLIVIAERFSFYRRSQLVGESVADFVAELRRLARNCQFGDFLDEALRDRLVCGLQNEAIQRRLLTEAKLTFAGALELAKAQEAAELQAKQFKDPDIGVHKLSRTRLSEKDTREQCTHCGRRNHPPDQCRLKDCTCHKCGEKGHIARVCKNRSQAKWVGAEEDPGVEQSYVISCVGKSHSPAMVAKVCINGSWIRMEVDTGAAVSIVSECTYRGLRSVTLKKSRVFLRTYSAEPLVVLGEADVEVQYKGQPLKLRLIVVKGDGPSLMGREWIRRMEIDWKTLCRDSRLAIHQVPSQVLGSPVESLIQRYSDLFHNDLGKMRHFKATLKLLPDVQPKFHRPRPVPFALKEAVERELDRLEEAGVIEKVTHCEWAAPVVVVPKKNGTVRLCGDYKVSINQALMVDQYPLPKPSDLFAALSGGKWFTKLDLAQAYTQMELDEVSRQFVAINTHRGLYRYTRLPFGIASAPAIFQRAMDTILQGMSGVLCYLDDTLIVGKNKEEHLATVEEVLKRLQNEGLRVNKEKCCFLTTSVQYLGHRIDANGIHATGEKLDAVLMAPVPSSVPQLRSFLGMINYYSKFIPNLATLLNPLNELLRKDVQWKWTDQREQAFKQAKQCLTSPNVLVHYDPTLPIKLAGDASAYGIGAVISHTLPDGSERPIAFASRTLNASERNYAQLEKEALSLIFGVKKFHEYLYGHRFTLLTDHKPLTTILGPKTGVPPLAAARLQRWALLLSAYEYDLEFRPTAQHANADGLSRLPLSIIADAGTATSDSDVFNVGQIEALPVTAMQLRKVTRQDPILSKVVTFTRNGWPSIVPENLKPYWTRRNELTVEGDCLMWGIRVVVPAKLQEHVLQELHKEHPGASRMKALARSYLWWPGLDKCLEEKAKSCLSCQEVKNNPPVAPLHPWIWPTQPWKRVHIDFAGPFKSHMFLVVIDAHSKWPEVKMMQSTTSQRTIEVLRELFSSYGLPEQVVSDNGPQFVSAEFETFMRNNGIKHIRCAPYHPSSNGLAERFIQTFKKAMLAGDREGCDLKYRLCQFLLKYRSSPHTTTDVAPCELFLKRSMRTRLDMLKPDLQRMVLDQQAHQKLIHDKHARGREFVVGQNVMVRNLLNGPKWVSGVISERRGPLTYLVEVGPNQYWRRHVDHIRDKGDSTLREGTEEGKSFGIPDGPIQADSAMDIPEQDTNEPYMNDQYPGRVAEYPAVENTELPEPVAEPPVVNEHLPAPETGIHRYPQRQRRPPDRY